MDMRATAEHRPAAKAVIILVMLLSAGLPLAGCSGGGGDAAGTDSTAAVADSSAVAEEEEAEATEKAISVDVGTVRQGDLVMPIYADGAIRTPRSVEIRTKVGGELVSVLVRDGDKVRAGQVLARIDPREYAIALEEARYRHLQALSQMAAEADTFTVNTSALRDFAADREALDTALKRGSITMDEHRAQLLAVEMAALEKGAFRDAVFQQRTGLAEARMAEERTRLNLEHTEIRAPFAGTVQGLEMVTGQILSVNQAVCSVYNNDNLEAALNVLEADLGNLAEGRPVLLAIPATGDTLRAVVDVLSPVLDEASRTCEVLVRFVNPEGRYRPGMFVRAQIAGFVFPDRLLVPKAAVLIRDNRPLVFKREDDRAKWLYVDTGLENDEWIEITAVHSGGSLAAGEQIVVSDHLTLAHEAKIKVRKTVPGVDRWAFATAGAESGR